MALWDLTIPFVAMLGLATGIVCLAVATVLFFARVRMAKDWFEVGLVLLALNAVLYVPFIIVGR